MENTPKSKLLSFKTKRPDRKPSKPWYEDEDFASVLEERDAMNTSGLDTPDNVKTPIPTFRSARAHTSVSSPQFRVGWNDGCNKASIDMSSPVSIFPERRLIKRCPPTFSERHRSIHATERKDEPVIDVQDTIEWASRLMEFIVQPSSRASNGDPDDGVVENAENTNENPVNNVTKNPEPASEKSTDVTEAPEPTNKSTGNVTKTSDHMIEISVTKPTEHSDKTNIEFDDEANELMIMCSQAVEEKVLRNRPTKHLLTPEHHKAKRFKEANAECIVPKTNNFNESNCNGNRLRVSMRSNGNLFKKPNYERNSWSSDANGCTVIEPCNQLGNEDPMCRLSRDNVDSVLKTNTTNRSVASTMEVKRTEILKQEADVSKNLNSASSTASVNNDTKSLLDEEDDLFSSIDLNLLDNLQNTAVERSSSNSTALNLPKTVPVIVDIEVLKPNTNPPAHKYTKEQIEQRRIEAKKRLLFNKKHRSM